MFLVKFSRFEVFFFFLIFVVRLEDIEERFKGYFSFGDVLEEVKVFDDNGSFVEDGY